jgi:hypothetical protein
MQSTEVLETTDKSGEFGLPIDALMLLVVPHRQRKDALFG